MSGVDAPAPFRTAFDNARDPYTARNALGITDAGFINSVTAPLSVTGGTLTLDSSALNTTVNCGRLLFVSTTALSFKPYHGDRIKINGVIYQIPAAGIAGLANTGVFVSGSGGQNLSAFTTYYVYAFRDNSGTITADFSGTGHATSATAGNVGTEIKSGDDTRTLIGLVFVNSSAQFQDDAQNRFVISWFNRRNIFLFGNATGTTATTSGTLVELDTSAKVWFLVWGGSGGEAISFGLYGTAYHSAAAGLLYFGASVDGSMVNMSRVHSPGVSYYMGAAGHASALLSEGIRYVSPAGAVGSGTGTYLVGIAMVIRG